MNEMEEASHVKYDPPTVKVTIKLKREQRDRDTNFYMTFKGKRTKVTSWVVRFYAYSLKEAIEAFEERECIAYEIRHGEKEIFNHY